MNSAVSSIPMNMINLGSIENKGAALSASQKKRISLKKQAIQNESSESTAIAAADYSKTIEQLGSPGGASTINLENMKKAQSLHYMRASSGASSPQQIKSRTSIGKYAPAANGHIGMGMQIYNNYH